MPHRGFAVPPVLETVETVLSDLVVSADPAVVFASLARSSVPGFGEHCEVDLTSSAEPDGDDVVATGFASPATDPGPRFRGVVVHRLARAPEQLDVLAARLLVDRAVSTVVQARLGHRVFLAQEEAEQLYVALAHSREIGPAIGILMVNHKITYDAAFELLRQASQNRNRKLHDLAIRVLETGILDHATSSASM